MYLHYTMNMKSSHIGSGVLYSVVCGDGKSSGDFDLNSYCGKYCTSPWH